MPPDGAKGMDAIPLFYLYTDRSISIINLTIRESRDLHAGVITWPKRNDESICVLWESGRLGTAHRMLKEFCFASNDDSFLCQQV